MRILIIEDEKRIAQNLKRILEIHHYPTDIAFTGEDGLYRAEIEDYDVIIIDWMLPDIFGPKICSLLRKKKITTPILILTAKSQIEDKVKGFEQGADDYLIKPFSMEELLVRIKALIRRKSGQSQSPIIKISNLVINTNTYQVKLSGKIIHLAPKEYALLEYLARNPCIVINRMSLLDHVWGEEIDTLSNTIDVHIRYLRRKIGSKLIVTVKNKGYMLCNK